MAKTIKKMYDGYRVSDDDDVFRFDMDYDENGKYIGQWQTNVLDDTGDFFFPARIVDGKRFVDDFEVKDLTREEMQSAR